jgi:hypothetical protein
MSKAIKLKYLINYNYATFNTKTMKYETKQEIYNTLKEAKANRWRCEKCQYLVGTYNRLVLHKNEHHSY